MNNSGEWPCLSLPRAAGQRVEGDEYAGAVTWCLRRDLQYRQFDQRSSAVPLTGRRLGVPIFSKKPTARRHSDVKVLSKQCADANYSKKSGTRNVQSSKVSKNPGSFVLQSWYPSYIPESRETGHNPCLCVRVLHLRGKLTVTTIIVLQFQS